MTRNALDKATFYTKAHYRPFHLLSSYHTNLIAIRYRHSICLKSLLIAPKLLQKSQFLSSDYSLHHCAKTYVAPSYGSCYHVGIQFSRCEGFFISLSPIRLLKSNETSINFKLFSSSLSHLNESQSDSICYCLLTNSKLSCNLRHLHLFKEIFNNIFLLPICKKIK